MLLKKRIFKTVICFLFATMLCVPAKVHATEEEYWYMVDGEWYRHLVGEPDDQEYGFYYRTIDGYQYKFHEDGRIFKGIWNPTDDSRYWRYGGEELDGVPGGYLVHGWYHHQYSEEESWWEYYDPETGMGMYYEWRKINGKWYYFEYPNMLQGGEFKIEGKYYRFGSSGAMFTGWYQQGPLWKYYKSSGARATNEWVQVNGKWYHFDSKGYMQTGWQKINNKWYYLKPSGAMAAKEWCGGYWLNADGTWTYKYKASWKKNSKGWWFGDESGWYAKNETLKIDDVNYTFNSSGYWVK